MKCLLTLLFVSLFAAVAQAAELQAVPNVYEFEGDQIWVVKRDGRHNTIVRKMDVERALQTRGIRIRGPRGGEITFCPPGGCPPRQAPPEYAPPQQEPPKFDMPGDEKPKLDLPAASNSPVDVALMVVAALAGGVSGYFANKASEDAKDDESEDDEPVAQPVQ